MAPPLLGLGEGGWGVRAALPLPAPGRGLDSHKGTRKKIGVSVCDYSVVALCDEIPALGENTGGEIGGWGLDPQRGASLVPRSA